jgi:asparagine synthase (glutamine-hydrolysing)
VSRYAITGEIRLDNREELFRSLDVPTPERSVVDDLSLALRAYERWGPACAEKLIGDFAFLVSDDRSQSGFGARDALGARPFHYRRSERGLAFAVRALDLPAIDGLPLAVDEVRVADVCVPGLECVDATSTLYRDVFRLPPGHRLVYSGSSVSISRYWYPDPERELRLSGDGEYADAFAAAMAEAVRCRLDGPTAAMSSGGLDSAIIVGFARQTLSRSDRLPLITLSAVTADPGCEESTHIAAMARLTGLDPVSIERDDDSALRAGAGELIGAIEDPFDAAMLIPALLYAAAGRRGIRAVLDGVDGDIVASHEPDILDDLLRAGRLVEASREARGFAAFYRGTYPEWGSAARLVATSAARTFTPALVRAAVRPMRHGRGVARVLSESVISRDLAERTRIGERLQTLWALRDRRTARTPRERQARELTHPQVAAALERYHRVAAAFGVEARHPFFDRRLVELTLSFPRHIKVRDGWSKWIVRRAGEGLVPAGVLWRRGRWVRLGPGFLSAAIRLSGSLLAAELAGSMVELAPYVDLAKVGDLYRRHREGDGRVAEAVWGAAVLSSWLRKTRLTRYDANARANGHRSAPRHPFAGGRPLPISGEKTS